MSATVLPMPVPAQCYTDVLAKAEAWLPVLRERLPETSVGRRLPDATCREIRDWHLAQILQPARFGGSEAPLVSMVDVLVPVGAGCPATAWALAQYIMHNYMVARWPDDAQEEVWRAQPDCLISGILIPLLGKAAKVAGGYRLSGRWPFVTGVSTSDWCILSGMVARGPDEAAEERYFIVRTRDVTIVDNWYAIGLKGSSSNDVEVQDLFIPEHMSLPVHHLEGGDFPGRRSNPSPLYRPPVYMTFGILLSSAVLGMAEAMFEEYLTQSRGRAAIMSGKDLSGFATQHQKIGEVSASLQAAAALLRADCNEIMEAAEDNLYPNDMQRTGYRCNAAYAGRLAYGAAGLIWDLVGARGVYETSSIGRLFQDISVASRHVTQNWDINAIEHGRVRVRLPMTNTSL